MLLRPSPWNNWIEKRTKASRFSVIPLIVGTFLLRVNGGAGAIVTGRFLAQLAFHQGHTVSNIQVGLLSVAFYIVELTLAPVMGSLSDRWGRRLFLTIGPLFGLLQVTLLFFTPVENPFPYLLSLQVLAGLASAMQIPAALGYLADFTSSKAAYRMRIMSFYEL